MSADDGGALVVRLRATEATVAALARKRGVIETFMGNAVHQAFHRIVADAVAAALHDTSIQFQPFATSTLFRWEVDIPLQGRITAGEMGWVRFVALHPYVLRELEAYRRSNPRVLEIDRVPWQLMGCEWNRHLYAGRFCARARERRYREMAPPKLLRMRFLTPTLFKSRGRMVYEPEPRLVFAEGLLRRWQGLYPGADVPEGFSEFVTQHVHLRRQIGYVRRSVMVKAPITGFTGDAIYSVDAIETAWQLRCARFLGVMAEYATYAGVGKKTTMGLGMVDRVRLIPARKTPIVSD